MGISHVLLDSVYTRIERASASTTRLQHLKMRSVVLSLKEISIQGLNCLLKATSSLISSSMCAYCLNTHDNKMLRFYKLLYSVAR